MGQTMTVDGNGATAHVAYEFTEVAAIYPITPSSPMATQTDMWSAQGRKNMFDQTVRLVEMQSEAGAVGAIHGSLQTGALSTTFTSSQGLMLMIPTLYRIAGEHLPAVFHVAARTVGTHAMSIFGDHSDVMACRQTGVAMICSGSVQEAADLAAVAHLSAVKGKVPFMHFFDGFRTSHEISRIDMADVKEYSKLMDKAALKEFKDHALNPEHPLLRGTVQNDDVYFQVREANNKSYEDLSDIVEDYMTKVSKITNREYKPYQYYGAEDATDIIIAMGSVSGAVREMVGALNNQNTGRKYGFLQIHMYRPFDVSKFIAAIPASVKNIAVLDRCKEMGAVGEPLYEDVVAAFHKVNREAKIVGGRYGLSSRDTDPSQIYAVFNNLASDDSIDSFTIGIEDDVTFKSLKLEKVPFEVGSESVVSCKFWGLGGDGTVGANHNTIKIIGDYANMYSQAYFEYDAKKSFGITKSHLRMSKEPILGSYYVKNGDIVACHNQSYIKQFDIVQEIKDGGKFLLNCTWSEEELEKEIPANVLQLIAKKNIKFFIINATKIANELGLGSHTNTVLQAAFFKIADMIPVDVALEKMKEAAQKAYFAKGHKVVEKNVKAIEAGAEAVVEVLVSDSWKDAKDEATSEADNRPYVVKEILEPVTHCKGYDLPVSKFMDRTDGVTEYGLTAYEKRGIATFIPKWDSEKCIQCNMCSFVCPHAAIRSYVLDETEANNAPSGIKTIELKPAKPGLKYSLVVSNLDCTGCGSCVENCLAKDKAIEMVPVEFTDENKEAWDYGLTISHKSGIFDKYSVKGSQFHTPLVEFSAACAGCGETPYAKLLTQLFGDRVYWANATGCSQAWGSAFPGIPYTTNSRGFGPAWTNSLFENNAELMLGMYLSVRQQRARLRSMVEEIIKTTKEKDLLDACNKWLDTYEKPDASRKASDELISLLEKSSDVKTIADEILERKDHLAMKSFWMYGGDGWAYDIGFGGLDHVIAQGENINIFIIDTEVYSNTGGQSSKATPIGAVAQFTSSGKRSKKKDLGAIFMTYGNVYVAQVAMGANPAQLVKVLKEAEHYDGPSIVIGYTPCQAHGIRTGMGTTQTEMKRAVESGYWPLYHYDPRLENPFVLDSKEPTLDFEEFLEGETRYASLKKTFPENAKKLFEIGKKDALKKYEKLKKMEEN